ncbi:MAG: flagella basal body P-ring formation protein FlgA [Candidatus Dadabacteria bacterium]|nr:MAG: flagella basal body P-ring formation protein FlgA [Candidatus Dadabacteria bacterium]
MIKEIKIALIFFLISSYCFADPVVVDSHKIKIIGREKAVVTTPKVKLEDIADVYSTSQNDEEAVIRLKKIVVANSPKPGNKLALTAITVLQVLEREGVNLKAVGYAFPQSIIIERAARKVTENEIVKAIEDYLKKKALSAAANVSLLRIINFTPLFVPPEKTKLQVTRETPLQNGRERFTLLVESKGFKDILTATAEVQEIKEVPVATRFLKRGSVVSRSDIKLKKVNVRKLPPDAVLSPEEILGNKVKASLSYEEPFRKNKLFLPPVIEAGQIVTMVYRKGLLEATARGKALKSGFKGDQIEVQNTSSKRVVVATVIDKGSVAVK